MFSVTRLPILSALDEILIHLNWLAANSFFAFLFGLESLASSLHCGIQEPSSPGFKLSWSRVAERQNPSSKRTVPDKMNVNGIPVACLRLSQLNVKWSALRGDGAGWLGENLQVSLPPSLCCLSLLCDVGHGTIHQDEQQDLLLAEERRMEWVPRGKQRSRPNLNDIILKSCCGDSFRERWHRDRRRQNCGCITSLKLHSSGFGSCSLLLQITFINHCW